MTHSRSFTCLLILFGILCAPVQVFAAPKLSIQEATYQFGSVSQGETVNHTFTIKNAGDEELEIQRVVPSCGCTVSKLEKDALAPGEETQLVVDFDTRGMSGSKVKTVRLYTNDPEQLTALLTVKGDVLPELIVDPPRIHFGEVVRIDEGEGQNSDFVERKVSVKVRKGAKATINDLTSRSKFVEVVSKKISEKHIEAVVRLRKDADIGEFRDRVIIKVSNANQATVNLPLYASVRSPIQVKPQVLAFGIVGKKKSISKKARIEHKGPGQLQVLSVESESPLVSAKVVEKEPGKVFFLEAELDQSAVEKDLKTAIKIQVQSPESEQAQELLVSVTAVMPPKFLEKYSKGKKPAG